MGSAAKSKLYGLIVFAVACAWLIFHAAIQNSALAGEIGIVTAEKLNVRPEPGTDKAPVILIRKGTTVQVLKHDKGWVKIRYKDRIGWVKNRARYIRLEPEQGGEASAGPAVDTEIHRAKRKAEDIHRKIAAGQAEVATFSEEEIRIVNSLEEIDFALNNARKRRNALETEFADFEKKVMETEAAIHELSDKITESRAYAAKRLVALYKLDRIGRIHFLASAQSVYEFFQRETALKRILVYDRKMLVNLARSKAKLQRLLEVQQAQKTAKVSLEAELKKQIADMARKRAQKQEILSEIRSRKSLQMAALAALKQSAEDLAEKISTLSRQGAQAEPSFNLPDKPFADLKGLLKMPVEGRIISKFGFYKNRQFNVKTFRSGIDIQADKGEPIRAVCDGKVIYASWFKSYGNMMIIDHGDSYFTLYANIEEFFKHAGDGVEAGEVVATVGDTGSKIGPKLYFEIRHHGKPIDPSEWIDSG